MRPAAALSSVLPLAVFARTLLRTDQVGDCGHFSHALSRPELAVKSQVRGLSDLVGCYAAWHAATLAAWRSSEQPGCEGRRAKLATVTRGLGDAGGSILSRFKEALQEGELLLLDFQAGPENVWSQAMVAPFNWSLQENFDVLCFAGANEYADWRETRGDDLAFVTCPSCSTSLEPAPTSPLAVELPEDSTLLRFLFKPTEEVTRIVDSVFSKVGPEDRIFGVHFRSEWFGAHFACGCKDPSEIGKCASNLGSFMAARGVGEGRDANKVKIFVASDQLNGIGAFQRAFGSHNILALPDSLPIEHSLAASKVGSVRIFADFLLLAKTEAMLGTCGSTFSQLSQLYSGRPEVAFVTSEDSQAMRECAAGAQALDFSGFVFASFSEKAEEDVCGCYAKGDLRAGTCESVCAASMAAASRPRSCVKWSATNPAVMLVDSDDAPAWRPPLPRTIFVES